jgi:hypothetical protein
MLIDRLRLTIGEAFSAAAPRPRPGTASLDLQWLARARAASRWAIATGQVPALLNDLGLALALGGRLQLASAVLL